MSHHAYHRTLTTKIFCACKSDPDRPLTTFAESLALIRQIHAATAGCPQIVYLVGWQHEGHDARYPDWSVVNHRLAAPGNDPAAELRQLMADARQYNATVSLHINMDDAYPSSPLWQEYLDKDLLLKDKAGKVIEGGVWDGELSRPICKSAEWEAGLAKRRIDALCELLPIRAAGTIHIDAFVPKPSPGHGTDWAVEEAAVRNIVRYWNSLGIDVTTEYLADPALVDIHPMVYHDNRDEHQRLMIPPEVMCGGGAKGLHRLRTVRNGEPGWWGWFCCPAAGCRHPAAWGNSIDNDLAWRASWQLDGAATAAAFYRDALPWLRMNCSRPVRFEETATTYTVTFADGLVSTIDQQTGRHRIVDGGRVLLDGPDRCFPIGWRTGASIACHGEGGRRTWELGETWRAVGKALVTPLTVDGSVAPRTVTVTSGSIEVDLTPGAAVLIEPK
jgi:hypothetical protein